MPVCGAAAGLALGLATTSYVWTCICIFWKFSCFLEAGEMVLAAGNP